MTHTLLLLLACLLPPVDGPRLSSDVAAPRAWVELTGVATPSGRPKVWLRASAGADDAAPRRARTAVSPDGALRIRVPPLPQGDYDLLVRVPGAPVGNPADLLVMPAALRVEAPAELAVAASAGGAGDVLELTGRFLGPRRGRVLIASRRSRVLSWEVGVVPDESGAPLDRVRVRVPKRLGDGLHPITVVTAAGEGWLADAVLITDSPRGIEPVLRGDADGLRVEARAATVHWESVAGDSGLIRIQGFDGAHGRGHWLNLSLRYDPTTQGAADLRGDDAILQLVRRKPGDTQVWSSAYGWGGHARVHVLENDGGLLSGTVTGWLEPVYGLAGPLAVSASFVASSD